MNPQVFPQVLGKEFDEAIEFIRKSSIGTPKKLFIDLSTAHTNLELNITGNFFYLINTNDPADTLDVRFNEVREPAFTLVRMMGFYTPYYKFYITNTAQAGASATIVYGTLARPFLDIIDNRSPISMDLTAIRDELRGDTTPEGFNQVAVSNAAATLVVAVNANRKSCIVQNEVGNTGNLYLGYDNTVAANKHFVTLRPGEVWAVDDYRGAVYGLQTVNNDVANWGEV